MEKGIPSPPPPPPGFIPPIPPPPYGEFPPQSQSQPQSQPHIIVIGNTQFGSESQQLTCPYCHAQISTRVETESNMKTHLFALLLCAFGFWCCVPCPYCIDSCLSKKHYCPACNAYLGEANN
ncbi:lipopolysaccharide-induced tumor necrosis factor-alpha factor homolog isoform X1 [Apis dorsata]|uniref:lipopolysaccharide-induced tumor necrosis factor-alpha factor homolog isoform X1 n=1 Tax=Apis dorsata TaxID=7462 RepID=UPI0003DF4D57|nr:lipopolysaccharide-induced tumor necrosis factor-alpha factor homolog isoform X1 [Apis dorsata]